MKKLIIILILFLIFPLVSSVEFDMKTEFDQGETLLAVISGNFLDQINEDNVFFYREHVRIPVVYDVGKINEDFYIYAMLTGKVQGNYSVRVEDVRYMSGTETIDEDIVKNFTITENTADFSLNPGFVITSGDFFLEVQNLKDQKITIQIDTPRVFISANSLELKSGEIKKINFELDTESQAFEEINLDSGNTDYSIPVFVNFLNLTEEEEELEFKFEPNVVEVSMATDSDTKRIIYILNTGSVDVEDISFSVSPLLEPYVEISPETINDLDEDGNEKIEIDIISDIEPAILEGTIIATSGNFSTSMTLILDFIEDYVPEIGEENESSGILTTCIQLEGLICEDTETCTGGTAPTKDGICCLAQCEEAVKKSSTGKTIGWIIVIAVVLFLFWSFRKYKKVRPKVDLLKIGRKKK
ncbi:MAG TPA: hypothetical protein VMV95_01660 [Bacillota bacterium]|nr:hypothetical protein [Bacillota bacterium]